MAAIKSTLQQNEHTHHRKAASGSANAFTQASQQFSLPCRAPTADCSHCCPIRTETFLITPLITPHRPLLPNNHFHYAYVCKYVQTYSETSVLWSLWKPHYYSHLLRSLDICNGLYFQTVTFSIAATNPWPIASVRRFHCRSFSSVDTIYPRDVSPYSSECHKTQICSPKNTHVYHKQCMYVYKYIQYFLQPFTTIVKGWNEHTPAYVRT